jgi:hypothetical protein
VSTNFFVRVCPLTLHCRTLETVHTLCTWMWLYYLTVTNFGSPAALNDLPTVFNLTMPLQTLASSIVQACHSSRCFTVVSCGITGLLLAPCARPERQMVDCGPGLRGPAFPGLNWDRSSCALRTIPRVEYIPCKVWLRREHILDSLCRGKPRIVPSPVQ